MTLSPLWSYGSILLPWLLAHPRKYLSLLRIREDPDIVKQSMDVVGRVEEGVKVTDTVCVTVVAHVDIVGGLVGPVGGPVGLTRQLQALLTRDILVLPDPQLT